MEPTRSYSPPRFTLPESMSDEVKLLISNILVTMEFYRTDGNRSNVQSYYDILSEDDISLLRPLFPSFQTNPSLAPINDFFNLILDRLPAFTSPLAQPLSSSSIGTLATPTAPAAAPVPRQTLWEALGVINFETLLENSTPTRNSSWLSRGITFFSAGLSISKAAKEVSAAINQEDPIDGTFDLLRFIIKNLLKLAPQDVRATREYQFISENHEAIFDIMQELAHLAKAAKNRSFEGYEIIQLLAAGRTSNQMLNKTPGAMIARIVNKCTLERPIRILAWNLMNYGESEFTSTRRITWPILKLVLLPKIIGAHARIYSTKANLYPLMQKTLTKVADLADWTLDRETPLSSMKFRDFCTKLIEIEKTAIEADSNCNTALATFKPLIKHFHALIENTLTLSSAMKKKYTKADGFQTATAGTDLLTGSSFNGVSLPMITGNLISLFAEGMEFIASNPERLERVTTLSLSDAVPTITELTKKVALCSAPLAVAKKINPLAVALIAPFLLGTLEGIITTVIPPLKPLFPFSVIRHPISYAYSCANGLMEGNAWDCVTLSSDAKDMATVANGKMFPYAIQHYATKLAYPEAYRDLSYHEALVRAHHTKQTSKAHTVREDSTLHNTRLIDVIRNPIAYTTNALTGYYPEWAPGIGIIILIATINISLYNIYNTPEIKYDTSPIQMLGSGARAMKALRKNPGCTKKALNRINKVAEHFRPTNLKQKPYGHR